MASVYTPVPVTTLAFLLLVMEVKHYGADFVLQSNWMAQGKDRVSAWRAPLAAHAGLHGLGTLAVALMVEPALWWLGAADFVVHGLIDRGKALVSQRTRFPVTDARFWWLMGFDQFLHQVTNIAIVVLLVVW